MACPYKVQGAREAQSTKKQSIQIGVALSKMLNHLY